MLCLPPLKLLVTRIYFPSWFRSMALPTAIPGVVIGLDTTVREIKSDGISSYLNSSEWNWNGMGGHIPQQCKGYTHKKKNNCEVSKTRASLCQENSATWRLSPCWNVRGFPHFPISLFLILPSSVTSPTRWLAFLFGLIRLLCLSVLLTFVLSIFAISTVRICFCSSA